MLQLLPDYCLQRHNTLAIKAVAREFAEIRSVADLRDALKYANSRRLPLLALGGGSNIVLADDFPGLALHIQLSGREVIDENDEFVWLRVGAGENWQRTVDYCLNFHFWGLENLSLIPGSVGAAPIQNIGAYGVELKDLFAELQAMEVTSGVLVNFDRDACEFGYRDSVFKGRFRDRYIITSVTLKLRKEPKLVLDYPALRQALEGITADAITPELVSQTVCDIRRSKLPDPAVIPNAGSFFKNPVVSGAELARLKARFPDIAAFVLGQDSAKVAAGWLIERAGMKGVSRGKVAVHDQQALVLTNPGEGSGKDLLALANEVVERVQSIFGISLEMEPRVYL